jgi:hypothetical protein
MRPCGTERAPIAAPVLIPAKAVTWSGARDSQGGHLERRTRQPGRSPGAAPSLVSIPGPNKCASCAFFPLTGIRNRRILFFSKAEKALRAPGSPNGSPDSHRSTRCGPRATARHGRSGPWARSGTGIGPKSVTIRQNTAKMGPSIGGRTVENRFSGAGRPP